MTIGEITRQGFHYARSCKSLWLFGFFVGVASGGSPVRYINSSGSGTGSGDAGGLSSLPASQMAVIAVVLALAFGAFAVMRYVSEGALIEGITRARRGGTITTREGFRAGCAHWGVLVRIALLYFAATIGSVVLLAAPCVLALQALGPLGGAALGVPAVAVGAPWLVTLYLVQAFASQIAVHQNRLALDAVGKARLFLHGRLIHGLKLLVAMLLGTLVIAAICIAVLLPVALVVIALTAVLHAVPLFVVGCALLLPVVYVFAAMVGTLRSSIWTIGYLTQVES